MALVALAAAIWLARMLVRIERGAVNLADAPSKKCRLKPDTRMWIPDRSVNVPEHALLVILGSSRSV